jgi:LacI family transcriptional regulator
MPEFGGGDDVRSIVEWLKPLPRPLAVLACDDERGRAVLQACAQLDVVVPEEVAVLGLGDDAFICELANPPLSSVRANARAIGFHAARMLAELMDGRSAQVAPVLVPPLGVVTRASTERPAIDDTVVARALNVIRHNACTGLNVEELLEHLTVSRATLERRFAKALNCSPKDEILRLRLERAQQLLRETNYNLAAIATLCGFKTAAHLSVTFKAKFKQSPGQYRGGGEVVESDMSA